MSKQLICSNAEKCTGAAARFTIGQPIQVVDRTDDTTPDLVGSVGRVVHFDYDCGCGQSPGDPMIGVDIGGDIVEFWKEELEAIKDRIVAMVAQ